ncbi:Ribosomal protein [Quillaja saponaria]|uniref:Ribosomal protein n=1 Tax=Quillaja saponaria TaxID=32244 RepID=A0AAD7PXI6_QUISA|nr:Ribosomal protein [Quillaja saponaria]
MVYFHSSISVCKSVDQTTIMPISMNSADPNSKPRQTNYVNRNRKIPNSSICLKNQTCHRSRSVVVDFVILIADLGICCAALATWVVVICTSRKCGNPNCKGLRKAAEFDIQLETEECVKNSPSAAKDGVKKGLFELFRDHHRELEADLKKMAPPNGRAVLVFRARCGCSVGRLEVPGPKKLRKIKK